MKNTIIVRERGQLTIPGSIRKVISWVAPMSAVTISVVKPDEIIIRPQQSKVDKDKVWKLINKSRAIRGKGTKSASVMIAEDRQSH